MATHRDNFHRSTSFCPETCPDVEAAFEEFMDEHDGLIPPKLREVFPDLLDKVKEVGTIKMREALVAACDELHDAEALRDKYEQENERLQSYIAELEAESA